MKGTTSEMWARKGFKVVNGELVRIKHADRIISETPTADSSAVGSAAASEQGAENTAEDPELSRAIDEEPENDGDSRPAGQTVAEASTHYQAGTAGVDEEGYRPFRITVTFCVSNRGRRDPTGAYETICDVITATRRRLFERLTQRKLVGPIRVPRRGGSNNNSGKVVGKEPF